MDSAPFATLLEGQVAVITGGGGGIGRAIALALADSGANVVIGDIDPDRCAETEARIRERGQLGLGIPTDVMQTGEVAALIDTARQNFGRVDVLVNNAGGTGSRPFLDQSEAAWRRSIDRNLVSMLAATSAAVPVMIAGGRGGAIVNVASIEASRAAPGYAVYAACKAAMVSFTHTAALEFADFGIRVNAIAPDYTETPGLRGNISGPVDPSAWIRPDADEMRAALRRIPLGRIGVDVECANVAVFLASALSSYVTGVVIPVDGGTSAGGGWMRSRSGEWTLMSDTVNRPSGG